MLERLTLAETNQELSRLIRSMRHYISYRRLTTQDCHFLKESCTVLKESLEKVLSLWTSLNQVTWPHQKSPFDAFMGHLFFPVQFEYLFETTARLQLRPHLQELLAFFCVLGKCFSSMPSCGYPLFVRSQG